MKCPSCKEEISESADKKFKPLPEIKSERINTFHYNVSPENKKLIKEYDTLIIVKSCNIQYKKPAKLEDELEIDSKIKSFTKTSFTIDQTIKRKEEIISLAEIVLVTVDKSGKPIKIPKILANFIK